MDAIWIPTMPVRRWVGAILSVTFVLVAACTTDGKTDRQTARERANAYVAANPELDPKIAASIRELDLIKGMTPAHVTAAWGKPAIVQKSMNGTTQLWYFPCDYPHHCLSGGSGGRRRGSARSEEDRYQSRAFFVNSVLTEWRY